MQKGSVTLKNYRTLNQSICIVKKQPYSFCTNISILYQHRSFYQFI